MISPLYGLGVGQTNDYVSKKDFVAASAGLLFAWGIGASIGPVVAAPAMRFFGANGLFYFVSACHVVLAGFIAYRMIARPRALGQAAEQLRGRADHPGHLRRPRARPARRGRAEPGRGQPGDRGGRTS